jgi:16S rRNA (guanine(1405)-N(7))-methyltransferase
MGIECEKSLSESLLRSKAGREVCPAVVRNTARWALARHPAKEAEKAAKARLHQFYGSWVAEGWAKRAEKALTELERDDIGAQQAAERLLSAHSSTRERLAHIGECYDRIFAACGAPPSVLDIACGMNPVSFCLLGMSGQRILGVDAGTAVADTLNRFFALSDMQNAVACAGDVMDSLPAGRYDLALVMKFLPLAERLERGGALKLLGSIDADRIVVSFPTRSLSGRNVGMERNYSAWFEGLGYRGGIVNRFVCAEEIFYIVKGADHHA